jgi:hypothetical protein
MCSQVFQLQDALKALDIPFSVIDGKTISHPPLFLGSADGVISRASSTGSAGSGTTIAFSRSASASAPIVATASSGTVEGLEIQAQV